MLAALRPIREGTPLLVKSFDPAVVARLAAMDPGCPVGLLVGQAPGPIRAALRPPRAALKTAVEACRELRADFLSPHQGLLADEAAAHAELAEMPTYPWTVNAPAAMSRLALLPIRGMITDRPDLLLQVVRGAT